MNVVDQLILRHPNMAHCHSQTQNLGKAHTERDHHTGLIGILFTTFSRSTNKLYLFHLEFDCGLDLIHLGIQVLVVGEQRGEFSGFVQARAKDTRDLLNQGLGSQEGIVFLCCGAQASLN